MKPVKEMKLRIIFITDIHMKWDYLESLKKWYIDHTNSHEPFDFVFIGGDTENGNNKDEEA